ncbi:cob(I)yrinic acid a,c-diamide adenosyltransferase [Diplocloster hominis]|uniref:cob(I)yrinic acid a,c-diamide adenosyltransferase n=1 Tax=Diplocloster hominis TaxID=3079010 RepID=UPI0031BB2828
MSIYTRTGDSGMTSLMKEKNISKSDDRIQLLGTIDELTSNLGLVKADTDQTNVVEFLERIQNNLMTVMAKVADPFNKDYRLNKDEVTALEQEINRLESLFEREKKFILPGKTRRSAQMDVARTVARRAERWLVAVDKKYGGDQVIKQYMNRLADYLYMLARYTDYSESNRQKDQPEALANSRESAAPAGSGLNTPAPGGNEQTEGQDKMQMKEMNEALVQAVLHRLGTPGRVGLDLAKKLIEKIELHALQMGLPSVIAICTPEGNPVAVHVMDGAFLASFDIAMKKAYTSVAVKMSTMELSALAQPGGTFYGVDKADNGRLIIFGGGIPLKAGDTIIGGLGISGGTGEQDHELAEYGQQVLKELL